MLDPSLFYWILVPMALVGGFVRGFAGFGGPLLIVPVLNLFLPPATTVALILWIDIFVNIRLLPDARRHAAKDVVVPLTLGTLIAMPIGAWVLLSTDPLTMKKAIAAAILVAALFLLTGWRYRKSIGRPVYGAVGALAGFVMGSTSIAAVTPLFLSAGDRTATENRANFIVWVFFATLLILTILGFKGVLTEKDVVVIVVLAIFYFAGTELGTRVHYRVDEKIVRRAVLGMVIVAAGVGLIL